MCKILCYRNILSILLMFNSMTYLWSNKSSQLINNRIKKINYNKTTEDLITKFYYNLINNGELYITNNTNYDFDEVLYKMNKTGDMCEFQHKNEYYYNCKCSVSNTHYFSINTKSMNVKLIGFIRKCDRK